MQRYEIAWPEGDVVSRSNHAQEIAEVFIRDGSKEQVNVSAKLRQKTLDLLEVTMHNYLILSYLIKKYCIMRIIILQNQILSHIYV